MGLLFKRGTSSSRATSSDTLPSGQPFYETDTNMLYIGGGALSSTNAVTAGSIRSSTGETFTFNRTHYESNDAWLLSYKDLEVRYTLPLDLKVGSAVNIDDGTI